MRKIFSIALVSALIGTGAQGHPIDSPCETSILELTDVAHIHLANAEFLTESMKTSASQFEEAGEIFESEAVQTALDGSDDPLELREAILALIKSSELFAKSSITRRRMAGSLSGFVADQADIIVNRVMRYCLSDER